MVDVVIPDVLPVPAAGADNATWSTYFQSVDVHNRAILWPKQIAADQAQADAAAEVARQQVAMVAALNSPEPVSDAAIWLKAAVNIVQNIPYGADISTFLGNADVVLSNYNARYRPR